MCFAEAIGDSYPPGMVFGAGLGRLWALKATVRIVPFFV